jgi:hypothetical protein
MGSIRMGSTSCSSPVLRRRLILVLVLVFVLGGRERFPSRSRSNSDGRGRGEEFGRRRRDKGRLARRVHVAVVFEVVWKR